MAEFVLNTEETLGPRETGVFVSKNSKDVFIHEEAIPKMVKDLYEALERDELRKCSMTEHETFPSQHLSQKDALNYVLFLDALNFCFWTPPREPKWNVKFKDVTYTGYFALCAAVARAYDEGIQIFDPKVYLKYTLEDLNELLKGDDGTPVPLIEDRLKCIHEVGTVLVKKYNGDAKQYLQFILHAHSSVRVLFFDRYEVVGYGSFENCITAANSSAQALLKIIVQDFPCFDDSCKYLGKRVSFHKRAQILIGDVWGLYGGEGISNFDDIDSITMFADYRVPQVLVAYGILEYSQELMAVLKKHELMKSGSVYEVEIRGCSIRAVDLVVQETRKYMKEPNRKYFSDCNDITVDNYLWSYRRQHVEQMDQTPFHKVKSIYY